MVVLKANQIVIFVYDNGALCAKVLERGIEKLSVSDAHLCLGDIPQDLKLRDGSLQMFLAMKAGEYNLTVEPIEQTPMFKLMDQREETT